MADSRQKQDQPGELGEQRQTIALLVREIVAAAISLLRSELSLMKVEATQNIKSAGKESIKIGIAVLFAILGGQALLFAVMIGVGHILGERFGLGALITALFFIGVGGLLAYRAARKISADASLPVTRLNLKDDQTLLSDNLYELSDQVRNRRRKLK